MALIRYAQPGLHGDKEPEPNLSYEYIPKERYTSEIGRASCRERV